MKKIINYINICHIVLNKIYIHIRVLYTYPWYYFNVWEGYNCRAIGPHRAL